jgi:hypothetical protein
MLMDDEVIDVARRQLASELAGVSPSDGLLADVRARHAKGVKRRRAAVALLGTAAAAALVVGVGAGVHGFTPGSARHPVVASQKQPTGTERIVLDGYTIKVAAPLRLTTHSHGQITATLAGRQIPLTLRLSGAGAPAGATRVAGWQRPAYMLGSDSGLALYVPFPVVGGHYHSIVLAGPGLTESQLLRIAAAITVAGKAGYLKQMPPSSHPSSKCPCG